MKLNVFMVIYRSTELIIDKTFSRSGLSLSNLLTHLSSGQCFNWYLIR